jgi:hypothetical protein
MFAAVYIYGWIVSILLKLFINFFLCAFVVKNGSDGFSGKNMDCIKEMFYIINNKLEIKE